MTVYLSHPSDPVLHWQEYWQGCVIRHHPAAFLTEIISQRFCMATGSWHPTCLNMEHTASRVSGRYGHENTLKLMHERRNSSALAMELRLSCINPSIFMVMRISAQQHEYVTNFLSIVAPEVVKMTSALVVPKVVKITTYGAVSKNNFDHDDITFQCFYYTNGTCELFLPLKILISLNP